MASGLNFRVHFGPFGRPQRGGLPQKYPNTAYLLFEGPRFSPPTTQGHRHFATENLATNSDTRNFAVLEVSNIQRPPTLSRSMGVSKESGAPI